MGNLNFTNRNVENGNWLIVDRKRVLNFCSNNYLGLANHPKIVEAAALALKKFGVGPGAVRSIAGTMQIHTELEQRLAQFKGVEAAVVSMPSWELFAEQPEAYQKAVIGNSPVKIAVEAGIRQGWDHFIGSDGIFVGMSSFGASGPYKELYKHFGITPEAVVAAAEAKLG